MPKSPEGDVTYESPATDGLTEELRYMTEEDLRREYDERDRALRDPAQDRAE
jgi:hypothetical protein